MKFKRWIGWICPKSSEILKKVARLERKTEVFHLGKWKTADVIPLIRVNNLPFLGLFQYLLSKFKNVSVCFETLECLKIRSIFGFKNGKFMKCRASTKNGTFFKKNECIDKQLSLCMQLFMTFTLKLFLIIGMKSENFLEVH